MSSTRSSGADLLALSVHGPAGVVDLQVPSAASGADVAREYARQASLRAVPALHTRLGRPLPAGASLADARVATGSVLVATVADDDPSGGTRRQRRPRTRRSEPPGPGRATPLAAGALSVLWCAVAVGAVAVAAWSATRTPDASAARTATVVLLAVATAVALVPLGALARHRVVGAPACAGAAAAVVVQDPGSGLGLHAVALAAGCAAATAALAWGLRRGRDEGLRVWLAAAGTVAVVAGLGAVVEVEPQAVWAVLLLLGALAARWVPALAVTVPDHHLLDLDRLAVSAWTAHDRAGAWQRPVVPREAVVDVVERGARTVRAASLATAVVVPAAAVLLLHEMTRAVDLVGARLLVGLAGAAVLLASRNHRHPAARRLLRLAGLACWAALARVLLLDGDGGALVVLAAAAVVLGAAVLAAAVALGRGWRSTWWSRAADVAETACGALAIGAVVVASGLVRALWTIAG
ncbi:hypothetical protein [Nocardioides litoris]|uniref:hypothetical protein n=1 Tax=Nocardioides litoris TaxID=1926648 RepID=UPI00112005D6|nr:hypothetical protein [Nocardioides litoris]